MRYHMSAAKAALLCALLVSSGGALAQKAGNTPAGSALRGANLGLTLPKVGVDLSVVIPAPRSPGVTAIVPVPSVAVNLAPPIQPAPAVGVAVGGSLDGLGGTLSVAVPSIGGVMPALSAGVTLDTTAPLQAGTVGATVTASGTAPGVQDGAQYLTAGYIVAGQDDPTGRRSAWLPTCR